MNDQQQPICLDSFEEVAPDVAVPLEVEVRVPNEHGGHYLRRKRWRTFAEVYRDMHKAMNLRVCVCGHEWPETHRAWENPCPKCGEGGYQAANSDAHWAIIDEYDSGIGRENSHVEIGKPTEHIAEILCYSNVGGNEGYQAHFAVLLRDCGELRYVPLYWIKSFRGMNHVHSLVARMMKATGIWPH